MSKRHGTETRRRSVQLGVRLLPEEMALLQEAARLLHVTPAEVLRDAFFGNDQEPR